MNTISAGTKPSSRSRAVCWRSLTRRPRSIANPARAAISSTLPSSDGWNVKKGSSIHRLEPRVAWPRSSTRMMLPIIAV